MLNDHYEELATQRQVLRRPDPDWDFYIQEQTSGRLIFITAREGPFEDHGLVGYVGILLRLNPHYKTIGTAVGDLHYLMPKFRGKGVGNDMLKFAEGVAASCGASLFIMRTKSGMSEHGHIFKQMGYELTDLVYTKDISNVETPVG